MSISFDQFASSLQTVGTPISLTIPAGLTVDDDIMILTSHDDFALAPNDPTGVTGWTLIGTKLLSSSHTVATWYKIVASGDAGSSVSVATPTNETSRAKILTLSVYTKTAGTWAIADNSEAFNNGAPTIATPNVDTTANSILHGIWTHDAIATVSSPPSGMTLVGSVSESSVSGLQSACYRQAYASATNNVSKSLTWSASDQLICRAIVIEAPSAGDTVLVISDISQAQTIDNVALIQAHTIDINPVDQAQTLDSLDLVQQNILVINGMNQTQALDNVDLIRASVLAIDGMNQTQALGNPDLVQANILVINGMNQAQTLDNIDLQLGIVLQIGNVSQSQTIESIDLIQANILAIDPLDQAQALDNVTLSVGVLLVIADMVQSQNIESLNLIRVSVLDIDGTAQAQTLENITLDAGIVLQIADIVQNQTIENLDLTQGNILDINSLLQAQVIDNIVFSQAEGKIIITLTVKSPSIDTAVKAPSISIEIE